MPILVTRVLSLNIAKTVCVLDKGQYFVHDKKFEQFKIQKLKTVTNR